MIDVRGKKPEPVAQSEDQEDELLSIVAIRRYFHLHMYLHMLIVCMRNTGPIAGPKS